MQVTVVDGEWTFQVQEIAGRKNKLNGSPYLAGNRLISWGWDSFILGNPTNTSRDGYSFFYHLEPFQMGSKEAIQTVLNNTTLLVGHNLKADLAWLYECGFTYSGKIWDTMIADYVLARGLNVPLDLGSCCERRGCSKKAKDITQDYVDKGISFENIPIDQLEVYGRQDIKVTKELFLAQWALYQQEANKGLMPTIHMMNEFLFVILEMERNGIKIDRDILARITEQYEKEQQQLLREIQELIYEFMGDTPVNINSNDQLSQLIYSRKVINKNKWATIFNLGSEIRNGVVKIKYKTRMSTGEFVAHVRSETELICKTKASNCAVCAGERRILKVRKDGSNFKKATKCPNCHGEGFSYEILPQKAGLGCIPTGAQDTAAGGFAVDKETLQALIKKAKDPKARKILEHLVRLNAISTYKDTFCEGIRRNTDTLGILRTKLNQCVTATARLSSSDPNFQNIPRGNTFPLKECIVSRFEGGNICEADFAQLEFRIAVDMAHDAKGFEDVLNGVDVHLFTSTVLTDAGQPTNRQDSKPHTFKPLYGGTSGTPAEQSYYTAFLRKYSGIAEWQLELQEAAIKYKVVTIPSGRQYAFPDAKRTPWGSTFATQIKNYPVQGFATGDIVPCSGIEILREFHRHKLKSVLFLTTHDSWLVDVYPGEEDTVIGILKQEIENIKAVIKARYNYELTVPMGVEIKMGPNWLNLKEVYKTRLK